MTTNQEWIERQAAANDEQLRVRREKIEQFIQEGTVWGIFVRLYFSLTNQKQATVRRMWIRSNKRVKHRKPDGFPAIHKERQQRKLDIAVSNVIESYLKNKQAITTNPDSQFWTEWNFVDMLINFLNIDNEK